MSGEDVLAVDIGNTRIHAGVVSPATFSCHRMDAAMLPDIERFDGLVAGLRQEKPFLKAVVAGVVGHAADEVAARLVSLGIEVTRFSTETVSGITIHYHDRTALGADRCANALYAAVRFPGKKVVIVSAGSAVVIDVVESGAFYGGTILPGMAMQCRALHEFTDALPEVVCGGAAPIVPGTTTGECIESGVRCGIAGAIEEMLRRYRIDEETTLCATGGDWPSLAPLVERTFLAIPEMTLVGTALFLQGSE